MKAISVRMNDHLGQEFDLICRREDLKKNGVIVRLIDTFVKSRKRNSTIKKEKGESDPFLNVMGIYNGKPFNLEEGDIDKAVGV